MTFRSTTSGATRSTATSPTFDAVASDARPATSIATTATRSQPSSIPVTTVKVPSWLVATIVAWSSVTGSVHETRSGERDTKRDAFATPRESRTV